MSPTNVHKIFKRETIDTGLLQKISDVLEYNFFIYYSSGKAYENNPENLNMASDSAEAEYKKALDLCREKTIMLEKINALLEDKIQHLEKN